MSIGIIGYGTSFPVYRVNTLDILKTWQNMYSEQQVKAMNLPERGVLAPDEDTITLACDAARRALEMSGIARDDIGALYLGTETSPYVGKASASCLVDMLGIPPEVMCGDCQFSGKSGTMAVQIIMALVEAGFIKYGVAIGADTLCRHFDPGNPMEYSAAAGAAALVIGREGSLATLDATASYTSDTSDYWRLDGDRYIMWGGQAMTSTDIGMQAHMSGAVNALLTKTRLSLDDFAAIAIQQWDGASVFSVARSLGFSKDKVTPGVYADKIGNCGAASSLISLALLLETAQAKQKLLLVSYGWGAGSDAFTLTVTDRNNLVKPPASINDLLGNKIVVDYAVALKYERKFHSAELKASTFA